MSAGRKPRGDYADTLMAWWSGKEKDFVYGGPCGPDRALLNLVFGSPRMRRDYLADGGPVAFEPSLFEELEKRGYDVSTLRFTVKRKPRASGKVKP